MCALSSVRDDSITCDTNDKNSGPDDDQVSCSGGTQFLQVPCCYATIPALVRLTRVEEPARMGGSGRIWRAGLKKQYASKRGRDRYGADAAQDVGNLILGTNLSG